MCGQLWSYLAHSVKACTPMSVLCSLLLFLKGASGIKDGVGHLYHLPSHTLLAHSTLYFCFIFKRRMCGFSQGSYALKINPTFVSHHQTALWHLHALVPYVFLGDLRKSHHPYFLTLLWAAAVSFSALGGCFSLWALWSLLQSSR